MCTCGANASVDFSPGWIKDNSFLTYSQCSLLCNYMDNVSRQILTYLTIVQNRLGGLKEIGISP